MQILFEIVSIFPEWVRVLIYIILLGCVIAWVFLPFSLALMRGEMKKQTQLLETIARYHLDQIATKTTRPDGERESWRGLPEVHDGTRTPRPRAPRNPGVEQSRG